MNIFKALFGSKEETAEEKRQETEAKNFDVLKYDGLRALKSGQTAYAVQCLTHALELKDDLETREYLSRALIHTDNLPAAREQLQRLTEAEPDNLPLLIRLADVCYMMEDYAYMGQVCERALQLDAANPLACFLTARASIGQGDSINAVAMLTKAITLEDGYEDAYLLRAQTLLKMGDVRAAEADANLLLSRNGDNEDALLLKARIEETNGKHDEAVAIYNKVIAVNPFCLAAFKERGAIRLAQGDHAGAEEDMRMVLELDPGQVAGVNGEFSAEGVEQKVRRAYQNNNPFGLG